MTRRATSARPFCLVEKWDAESAEMQLMDGGKTVVSFGTTWCGPCTILAPVGPGRCCSCSALTGCHLYTRSC